MSKEIIFNLSAHKSLWNWLAKNPTKGKLEWPGWHRNGGTYRSANKCFACDYARAMCIELENNTDDYICHRCPLWDAQHPCYENEYFFYGVSQSELLEDCADAQEYVIKYAKAIAEAKVRPGVKCK